MKLLTFDIETWGLKQEYLLQPWRAKEKKAGIVSLVIGDHARSCRKWADNEPILNLFNIIKELSEGDPNTILCGWGLLFDLSFLIAVGGEDIYSYLHNFKFLDGLLLFKRLARIYKASDYEKRSESAKKKGTAIKYSFLGKESKIASLKSILTLYNKDIDFKGVVGVTYIEGYNAAVEFKVGEPVYDDKKMLAYNMQDTLYTHAMIDWLLKHTKKQDFLQAVRESTILLPFAKAWTDGILLDKDRIKEITRVTFRKKEEIKNILENLDLTETILKSPKQLSEFLTEKYQIELNYTAKGNLSVSEESLKAVLAHNKTDWIKKTIIKKILDFKELETEITKFITPAQELNEWMHPPPFLQGTITGRLKYSVKQKITVSKTYKNGKIATASKFFRVGLPMHQMKRGNLRSMLKAPDNYSIIEMDFSMQEMRIIAWLAEEPTMIKSFIEGKDLHALMGANLRGNSYDDFLDLKESKPEEYKSWRMVGKVTNLALQYRLSAAGLFRRWLQDGINKTESDAITARHSYLRLFPIIETYWNDMVYFAKNNGFIRTKAGRKIAIPEWAYDHNWSSGQKAINYPVQCLGADMKVLALYKLMPFLKSAKIDFKWDLHDGLYFYIPDSIMQHEILEQMKEIVKSIDYAKEWHCDEPPVKFPIEIKVGKNWGELKEEKF